MRLKLTEWRRATFAVHLRPDPVYSFPARAELAQGILSGPFGIYAGTPCRIDRDTSSRTAFTLVHLPSQHAKLTLPRQGLCRKAAEEFADCDLAWESGWAPGVSGADPEVEKAQEIYRRWKSWGVRKSWGER